MTMETERTERKRTTKPPDERRRDLMDAAVRVFREKGIARTTVSDITGVAGVAKGTFYLYFASKEHLLGALKESLVDEILAEAETLYSRVGREDWWALVDTTIEAVVDFHLSRADVIQIIVQEGLSPETSEIFRECEERVDAMYAAAIKAGRDAGVFRITDPEQTARLLHYALDGALKHAVLYVEEIDRDRLIAAARELVRKALAP